MPKFAWLGHSAFQFVTDKGLVVFVDPWISKNPHHPTKKLPEKADLILVTHDHSDHKGDAIQIANETGAKVIAQPETMNKMIRDGLNPENAIKMNIGGTVNFDGFQALMVHAFHTSETGVPAGYIMTIDGKVVYHLGDTGLFGDLKLFGELYQMDYALIPVGGHFTMDHKHGAIAAKMLNAKKVIPIHYKTFPLLLQDIQPFIDEVKRVDPKIEVLVPNVGEDMVLE